MAAGWRRDGSVALIWIKPRVGGGSKPETETAEIASGGRKAGRGQGIADRVDPRGGRESAREASGLVQCGGRMKAGGKEAAGEQA